MGAEALCKFTVNGKPDRGKARLESEVLQLRGTEVTLTIPFKQMTQVRAADGRLSLRSPQVLVTIELGPAAARWAEKILDPPSRLTKIGVKPDWRVAALGIEDQDFLGELEAAVAFLSIGRTVKNCDAIFIGATRSSQLNRLRVLKRSLKPDGALWVVRPKGRPEISEAAVMAAGKAAGLVDVKVVSFSATHTAEKFVIPVKDRPIGRRFQ
jgi:hypothetical protein